MQPFDEVEKSCYYSKRISIWFLYYKCLHRNQNGRLRVHANSWIILNQMNKFQLIFCVNIGLWIRHFFVHFMREVCIFDARLIRRCESFFIHSHCQHSGIRRRLHKWVWMREKIAQEFWWNSIKPYLRIVGCKHNQMDDSRTVCDTEAHRIETYEKFMTFA